MIGSTSYLSLSSFVFGIILMSQTALGRGDIHLVRCYDLVQFWLA